MIETLQENQRPFPGRPPKLIPLCRLIRESVDRGFLGFDHLLHVIGKIVYLLDHAAGSCAMNRESLTVDMRTGSLNGISDWRIVTVLPTWQILLEVALIRQTDRSGRAAASFKAHPDIDLNGTPAHLDGAIGLDGNA
jgi:hypothetical protein